MHELTEARYAGTEQARAAAVEQESLLAVLRRDAPGASRATT